jgi:antitoxin component of MazEF toxin-antitoxin module
MITVKLRNIGNSKGIIIPKELLVLCNMDEEVSIEIKGQQLIVSKVSSKSIDWEKAFEGCNAENLIMRNGHGKKAIRCVDDST